MEHALHVEEIEAAAANVDSAPVSKVNAFTRQLDDLPVEGGTDPVYGDVTWRTLISADRTPSADFLLGVAEFPAHGVLNLHRHAPPEFYLCTAGSGVVTIDGVENHVTAGTAVFIPGNAEHGVKAGADGLTFAYGFAQNAFSDIEYVFSNPDNVVPMVAAE
ncbi:MAG: cupin domain-containing protein [Albidovulum sp.]